VNNAGSGSGHGKTLLELSPEDIHAGYAANLYTTFFVTQAAVPHMPRGGRVVNVGTVISRVSLPGVSVYGSSKAAQDYLTLAWALEVRPFLSVIHCEEVADWGWQYADEEQRSSVVAGASRLTPSRLGPRAARMPGVGCRRARSGT